MQTSHAKPEKKRVSQHTHECYGCVCLGHIYLCLVLSGLKDCESRLTSARTNEQGRIEPSESHDVSMIWRINIFQNWALLALHNSMIIVILDLLTIIFTIFFYSSIPYHLSLDRCNFINRLKSFGLWLDDHTFNIEVFENWTCVDLIHGLFLVILLRWRRRCWCRSISVLKQISKFA